MTDIIQQQFCLKWNNHQLNFIKAFSKLLTSEHFTDVILAAEGRSIKAHRVVLSACSAYFEALLADYGDRSGSPIIILKDVSFADLSAIVEFMYKGEINVTQEKLGSLLKTAENLKVKGLAEVSDEQNQTCSPPLTLPTVSTPAQNTAHSMPHSHPELAAALGGSLGQYPQSPYECPPSKRKRGRPRLFDSPDGQKSPSCKSETPVSRQESVEPPPTPSPRPQQTMPETMPPRLAQLTNHIESPVAQIKKEEVPEDVEGCDREPPYSENDDHSEQTTQEPTPKMRLNPDIIFENGHVYYCGMPVVKLNPYLQSGSRSQFWEEPVTHRIMDSVRNRSLDMKTGADLLGVSYGTLYGRYRETFGYLKHAWNGKKKDKDISPVKAPTPIPMNLACDPTVSIDKRILDALLRKDLTLGQASAMLGLAEIEIYAQVQMHLRSERTATATEDVDDQSSDGEGRLSIDESKHEVFASSSKFRSQQIEPVNTNRID